MKRTRASSIRAGLWIAGLAISSAHAVETPGLAPSPHDTRKNRYISFVPNNPGASVAFLVELTESTLFPGSAGIVGWVGEPFDPGCPNPGDPPEGCAGELVSRLECVPVFRVWDDTQYVHVGDASIAPRTVYEISAVESSGIRSAGLEVETSPKPLDRQWGDTVGPFQVGVGWTGPDGFANVVDIHAGVLTMQGTVSVAETTWIDLVGSLTVEQPNYLVNISDIQHVLQGVAGWDYPFPDPGVYIFPGPPGCADCNNNGDCDECEIGLARRPDCNDNGIPDECDIGVVSDDCQPNGVPDECETDCNGNGVPDDCDVAAGALDCNSNGVPDECDIDAHTEGDCNSNGVPDSCDIADNPALDPDGDRLMTACELAALTDPGDPDTDGDGIGDGDEVLGTSSGIYLPGMGADPRRKTLLVEMDWVDDSLVAPHTHRPTPAAVQAVIDAFAAAPISNPDGSTGIDLIVDYGQGGLFTGGNKVADGDTVIAWPAEFQSYKATNFAANRQGYFRYCIHAHWHNAANSGSGFAEISGDDFVVTLGSALDDAIVPKTIMHELGHNLSLRHGGFEDRNYKPNYNSVMNYRYQFTGIDNDCDALGDGSLDFSYGGLPALDENSLDENAGVCGPGSPVDWDQDTLITAPVARNINCAEGTTAPCGSNPGPCYDTTCNPLSDYDDWANVQLPIPTLKRTPAETVDCTSTPPSSTQQIHSDE